MTSLQSAVSAVTGVTWRGASPPAAPAVGDAWDDGQLRVVLAVADPAENLAVKSLSASLITAALVAVPSYATATAASDVWLFAGRRATVGTWTKPSTVAGGTVTLTVPAMTAAEVAASSKVLAIGEMVQISDSKDLLVGDGATALSALAKVGSVAFGPVIGSDEWLKAWTGNVVDNPLTVTRDSNGNATSATVAWPDGTSGTYTATTVNSTWNAVDAYTVTYAAASGTKTVTQSAVTREATTGAVTVRPAMTVA